MVLLLLEVMEKNARPIYVWRMFGWVVESGAFSFLDLFGRGSCAFTMN